MIATMRPTTAVIGPKMEAARPDKKIPSSFEAGHYLFRVAGSGNPATFRFGVNLNRIRVMHLS
jgi:hypothetical protein